MHGIKMSCRLQKFLQQSQQNGTLRGVRVEDNNLIALNYYIYSIIRNNRSNRRALLMNSLKMFEDVSSLIFFLRVGCLVWAVWYAKKMVPYNCCHFCIRNWYHVLYCILCNCGHFVYVTGTMFCIVYYVTAAILYM